MHSWRLVWLAGWLVTSIVVWTWWLKPLPGRNVGWMGTLQIWHSRTISNINDPTICFAIKANKKKITGSWLPQRLKNGYKTYRNKVGGDLIEMESAFIKNFSFINYYNFGILQPAPSYYSQHSNSNSLHMEMRIRRNYKSSILEQENTNNFVISSPFIIKILAIYFNICLLHCYFQIHSL